MHLDPLVLCVDLDGVVGDYVNGLRPVVAARYGMPIDSIGRQTTWQFSDCPNWPIRTREEYDACHRRAVDDGLFRTMPFIDGASDALWHLNDVWDVHVRIVTHRLLHNGNHEKVVTDTVAWLQQPRPDGRPSIPYRDLCFLGQKAEVGGDIYLDDAPHNIASLTDAGCRAVVFDAPYNQDVPGPRVSDWDDVVTLVERLERHRRDDPLPRP